MHDGQAYPTYPHLHVLVAEDDALIAFDMEHTLAAHFGFKVSVVHSLDEGMALVARDPPDMAVLDFDLDGDGVEPLAAWLAASGRPMVFVSGYRTHPLDAMAGEQKLEKPHSAEQLVEMVSRALARLEA